MSEPTYRTPDTYHVRKTSIGLKRKYRITADDGTGRPGALLGYAEKQLKAADEIVIYRDEARGERLATVRESSAGLLASLKGYEVFDPTGSRLGSFGLLARKSAQRTTWELEQPSLGRRLTGTERSLATARATCDRAAGRHRGRDRQRGDQVPLRLRRGRR